MEKKKTINEMLDEVIALAKENNREDIVAFATERKEINNRKRANQTKTKTQVENDNLKEVIIEVLTSLDKAATISEIQDADERLQFDKEGKPITNQKMSALLKQLVDNKTITKVIEKRKAYFKIA